MSTTRVGDPTATQSPSVPPTPGAFPTSTKPVDGDACSAGSVSQENDVKDDFIAWLMSPYAQAAAGNAASNWAQLIRVYKNARQQSRFGIDHLGFPGGQIFEIRENWMTIKDNIEIDNSGNLYGSFNNAASVAHSMAFMWYYRHTTNGSTAGYFRALQAAIASAGNPFPTNRLHMECPNTGTIQLKYIETNAAPLVIETAGSTALAMGWDHSFNIAGINSGAGGIESSMGILGGATQAGSNNSWATDAPVGAAFVARGGSDSTWQGYVNAGSGATYVNTTVSCTAANVRRRFRIEVLGPGVSDDSTARINFYIDGVWRCQVAADLAAAGGVLVRPFFKLRGTTQNVGQSIGPMRFQANTYAGDVFL